MKTHTQNSPQTIRGMRERRTTRALLDTRKVQEADIRTAEYVGPFGKSFHKVQNSGGGEPYIVSDLTGGTTFAPGTSVQLGSNSGGPGEAVLGGPPPGKKGGGSRTNNRRRRGTVPVGANQYAFGDDGADLFAMLYSEGTFVSTRDSVTLPSETVCGIILTDDGLLVGDGSALLSDGGYGSSIKVWDVDGAVIYSYTLDSGWMLAAWPVYNAGAIYWLEVEDGTAITGHVDASMNVRLQSALTDLTGAAVLSSITLTATDYDLGNGLNHYHSDSYEGGALMVDSDGAVAYLYIRHHATAHEVIQWQHYQFRILLSNGSEVHRDYEADTYSLVENWVATLAAGGFIAAAADESYSKADDASTQATLLDSGLAGSTLSINVAPNGVTRQQFTTGSIGIYRNGVLVTDTVDDFDTINYPTQMFYFGED